MAWRYYITGMDYLRSHIIIVLVSIDVGLTHCRGPAAEHGRWPHCPWSLSNTAETAVAGAESLMGLKTLSCFRVSGFCPQSQCLPRKRKRLTFLRLQIFNTEFILASTQTMESLWGFQSSGLHWSAQRQGPILPIDQSQCWTPLQSPQLRWRGKW